MPEIVKVEIGIDANQDIGVGIDIDASQNANVNIDVPETPPVSVDINVGGGGGGGGTYFTTDETLTLENGVLSVNTAKVVEADNTLPVTSAAVFNEVGNINALLATI